MVSCHSDLRRGTRRSEMELLIHQQSLGTAQIVGPNFCRIVAGNVSGYHRRRSHVGQVRPRSDRWWRWGAFVVVFLRRRTRPPSWGWWVRVDLSNHVLGRRWGWPRAHARTSGYHPRMWDSVGVRRRRRGSGAGKRRAWTLQRWRILIRPTAQVASRSSWDPGWWRVTRHGPVARVAIVGNVAVDWMWRRLLLRLWRLRLAEALVGRIPVRKFRHGRKVRWRERPVSPDSRGRG